MSYIGNTNTTQAFTPAVDYFSGNGSTTAFTLSRPVASVAQVEAVIDNVVQNPSSAYTVSGNTITFTSAPLSGTNNIYIRYTSPITQVIAPGQGTVSSTSFASSTGSGAVVLATSPTIATPTINQLTSAASTNLTLQSAGTTAVTIDTSQKVGIGTTSPDSNSVVTISGATPNSKLKLAGGTSQNGLTFASAGGGNQFYLYTQSGGFVTYDETASAERMRIDSSGRVTMPYQPVFSAYRTSNQSGTTFVVTYQGTTINQGSHLNTGTGLFTAPINGTYVFSFSCIGGASSEFLDLWGWKNGSFAQSNASLRPQSSDYPSLNAPLSSGTFPVYLYAGDTFGFAVNNTKTIYSDGNCWVHFMGWLLC